MTRQIDIKEVGKEAQRLRAELRDMNLSQPMGEARAEFLQGIRDNFTSSIGPEGQAWPERKEKGDGHPLLMDKGDLLQAATGGGAGHISQMGARDLTLGVARARIVYAWAHQKGYPPNNLPARKFFGMRKETKERIGVKILRYVSDRL